MSAVTIDGRGAVVVPDRTLPQRVRLPRAAVDRLADLAGVKSPLRQLVVEVSAPPGVGRLGGAPTAPPAEPDADDVLERTGLLEAGAPTAAARAVLLTWHAPGVVVELEVLADLARGPVRVRSLHKSLGDRVVCLSTADGADVELAWLAVEDWWLELTRTARIETAALRPARARGTVPDVVETPWDLLLTTGEAVRAGRHDLLDRAVADHPVSTRAGRRPDLLEDTGPDDVRRWHALLESTSRGRLHAAVTGRGARGAAAGVVEWVLLPDGWRSLAPVTRGGQAMVRLQRVEPADLPRALAPLVAGVAA